MNSNFDELVDVMRKSMAPVLRRMWADVRHVPNAKQHVEDILMEHLEQRALESGDIDCSMLAIPAARRVIREFLKDAK